MVCESLAGGGMHKEDQSLFSVRPQRRELYVNPKQHHNTGYPIRCGYMGRDPE